MMKGRKRASRRPGLRVHASPERHQLGAVDLLDVSDVRRRVLRPDERLGDLPAHPAKGDPDAVGARRRRRRLRRAATAPMRADVVERDPACPARPRDLMDVDADVARQLARRRRGQNGTARRRAVAGLAGGSRRGRRLWRIPRVRARLGLQRPSALDIYDDEDLPDGAALPFGEHPFGDTPDARRADLDRRLVGHDLDHRLVLFEGVPLLDQPADHFALGDPLADVRKTELVDHQKFTTRSTASRTRSASGRYSRSSV